MGKFKIGDRVVVKDTGQKGTVKGREIIKEDESRVKVEYIVKLGEGFSNWKSFVRKDLERIPTFKEKKEDEPRPIVFVEYASDGSKVVCAGFIQKFTKFRNCFNLRIGWAICNPDDNFDLTTGVKIARRRAFETNEGWLIPCLPKQVWRRYMLSAVVGAKALNIVTNIKKFSKR